MSKIMLTAAASLMYFGLMKYMGEQRADFISGMVIVLSSMMYAAFLIAMLWVAYEEETEKTQEKR